MGCERSPGRNRPSRHMKLYPVQCNRCEKIIRRSRGRLTESRKNNWKIFCSKYCQDKSKEQRIEFKCNNPLCNKTFWRTSGDLVKSEFIYCSLSCAARINNKNTPKRIVIIKQCLICGKDFKENSKYCSKKCQYQAFTIHKDKILQQIQQFYITYHRIPLKREFQQYHAARSRFGTWNKAIVAAGFEPNPVRFANRHIANDGHECDSFAEKIIDDWLYTHNIPHERSVPYNYHNMTADFKIDDVFVEFLGLKGELNDYDRLVSIKQKLWKQLNLKIITLTPNDLFPKNKLLSIFTVHFENYLPQQQTLRL